MIDKLFFSIRKHTDTRIEQTRTKPQEAPDFKMNKQTQTFLFNPARNLVEERKWLITVISFEATNSAFFITDKNNSSSIRLPGHWNSEGGEDFINMLINLLELRSENDIEIHVKEVEERGTRIKIENSGYILAGFGHSKIEILAELKIVKHRDLEDMVYRLQLTYDEIVDILDVGNIAGSTIGNTMPVGVYEVSDNNLMLKSLLPNEVNVKITIVDVRLKSNLTTKKTNRITKNSFFYIILGFFRPHLGELADIERFIQLIP